MRISDWSSDVCSSDLMPMLERRARDAEVELVRVPGLEVLQVHADRRRVRQAVINLIDNAVKFTPAGGRVVVSQGADAGGRARITVTDNGIGMSPQQVARAFRAFERGTDPFVRSSEGVGRGLALSSAILKAHGGATEIASPLGAGTSACQWIPRERVLTAACRGPSSLLAP